MSVTGSVVPALVGALGTVLVATSGRVPAAVALLVAWSVVGYLSLTDFGLTRSASRLVSEGGDAAVVVGRLWRVSLVLGAALVVVTAAGVQLVRATVVDGGAPELLALCVVPLATALQFPLVGTLEAQGRFTSVAVQRTGNALFTYLLPALVVATARGSLGLAVASIVGFRIVSVAFLFRAARIRRRDVAAAVARRDATSLQPGAVVTWLAVSSVVGPALLYVDRAVLAVMAPSPSLWVFYVALSELMMKTYLLPSAVLAVLFPRLVQRRAADGQPLVRALRRTLPIGTLAAGFVSFVAVYALGQSGAVGFLEPLGAATEGTSLIAAIAVSCTVVNWSSQAYIAVLQSQDHQRAVSLVQLVLAAPYLLALGLAAAVDSPPGVAAAWGGRIVAVWLALWSLTRRRISADGPVEPVARP